MKKAIYTILVMAGIATTNTAFGLIDSSTEWRDIPPTNKLSDVIGSVSSEVVGDMLIVYTNGYQSGKDTWTFEKWDDDRNLIPVIMGSYPHWYENNPMTGGQTYNLDFRTNVWTLYSTGVDPIPPYNILTGFYAQITAPWEVQRLEFVNDSVTNVLLRFGSNSPVIATNTLGSIIGGLAQGFDATPIELSQKAITNDVTFINKYGENQNAAIEIGGTARAKMPQEWINSRKKTVLRSVSIAIGDHADAYVEANNQSQAIAIGWHAQAKGSNAIAIGNGAQHPDESAALGTGDATFARSNSCVSIGYSAWSTHDYGIAIGGRAKSYAKHAIAIGSGEGDSQKNIWTNCVANAEGAVQIGAGTNSTKRSLQFRDWQLLNSNGQIPDERMTNAILAISNEITNRLDRLLRPGNMTVIGNGTEWDDVNGQNIEPRLDGLSKVYFAPHTNGVFLGDTTIGVVPPIGSRNYDILIENIPDCYREENGELISIAKECKIHFGQLSEPRNVTIWCDNSIGHTNTALTAIITNTPCIIKVREVSTNDLFCVLKPWSIIDI